MTRRKLQKASHQLGLGSERGAKSTKGLLTEALINELADDVEKGVSVWLACRTRGISKRAAQDWWKRGENFIREGGQPEDDAIYGAFFYKCDKAAANYCAQLIRMYLAPYNLRRHDKAARLALEVLRRRLPEDWAGPDAGVVNVNIGGDRDFRFL